jgi:probable F420-dependent oxidoreductase
MEFGLAIFPTEDVHPPDELARMVEGRGFESLLFPEHTHIPAARQTPYPAGGELPPEYARTYDPFVACAAAATATSQLRIGTGICLVVERDPIITAKEAASVDVLSGGRFLFGVGAGWNIEEMANHGTDASKRFGLMRERVEAIKEIWSSDEASYSGRYVQFERIWCWPKPVQRPHPPVLVGGNGASVIDRVLAFGDEWMPNRVGDDDGMIARFEELARRAAEAGREPIPISLPSMPRDPARIERFADAGVHRALFWLPATTRDEVEAALEKYTAAAEGYRRAGG